MDSAQPEAEISFGPYQLDVRNARLLCDGRPVSITPKALDVLHYLASRPERLVTKSELFSAIWPDVVVGDASIKVCVRQVRKALNDGAQTPTYIETVHRRGYRFIAPLREDRSPRDNPPRALTEARHAAGPSCSHHTFVGREKELCRLSGMLDQARECNRQCLFISGGPGSGKTALIESFSHAASPWRGEGPPLVMRGHCFEQFGTSEPYMPVWEALGSVAGERSSASLSELLSRYAADYASGAAESQRSLLSTVGLPGSSGRLLRELADAVESLAAQTPLVLVLEDVHWADHSTIDLISALARRRSPARLMVVATYRPAEILTDEHPLRGVVQGLLTAGLAAELCMECLDEPAVAQFLAARFPASHFPPAVVRRLHQRTDGHPLFLSALVDDLVEQGVIVEQNDRWQITGARADAGPADVGETPGWLAVLDTQVPRTVRAMIEIHLARLSCEARQVLEAAAVVGVEFSAAAAGAGPGLDVIRTEQVCDELARHQRFLEPRGHVEWPDGTLATHYRFAHELYHSVVYEQIPIARRTRLHQQVGLRLEEAWGGRAAEEAAELAIHFETARDWQRAVKYFRQAEQAAGRQYAHRESAHYLQRALGALERLGPRERADQELDVLKLFGVNLQVTRGFAAPEVRAIHARAYSLCHAPGSPEGSDVTRKFPVLWGIWLFHKVRSDLNRARGMCDELLALAADDLSLRLQAHQAMCVTHLCLGDPRTTIKHMELAAKIYDPSLHAGNTQVFGQDPGVATLAFGAVALCLTDRPEEALSASERSLDLARRLRQPSSLALALHFAAMLHQLSGDAAETDRCAREAIAIAAEEGFSFWRAGGLVLRGWARVAGAGADPESGLDDIRDGLDAWLATGSRTYQTYFLGLLSDALQRLGRPGEALPPLDEAIAAAHSLPEGFYEAELHRLRGQVLLRNRKASARREARDAFSKALSLAHAQGAGLFERMAAEDLSTLLRARGQSHARERRPAYISSARRLLVTTCGSDAGRDR
jgi:DNA-binding winged helix-turn-helix (wHTH) protein/tetratricopeptide (TPR) repeat protein